MRVLVIGAGIAGTAAALALAREGADVAIYEARDVGSAESGAFLTLADNGVAALAELGVSVRGVPTPRMRLGLGDGSILTEFPMGETTTTVRRADLNAQLSAAVRDAGIAVRHCARLVGLDTEVDAATARFSDGSRVTGDMLIGADGIGSRTRALIDARAPKARYLGLLNIGGFAHGVQVPSEPGVMHMMFGRDTFFSWLSAGTGEVWWFANPALRREPDRSTLARLSGEHWRTRLLDLVRHDDPVATRVLEASEEPLPAWPMYDFPRVPVWHRGAAIIIGDAAHAASPSSGQGASMALEDGLALGLLASRSTDVATAFQRYEELRRPRVEKVIAQGKASSAGKAPGAFRPLRDAMVRWYFSKPRSGTDTSWLWDYRVTEAVSRA